MKQKSTILLAKPYLIKVRSYKYTLILANSKRVYPIDIEITLNFELRDMEARTSIICNWIMRLKSIQAYLLQIIIIVRTSNLYLTTYNRHYLLIYIVVINRPNWSFKFVYKSMVN